MPRAAWVFQEVKLKFEKTVSGVEVDNNEGEKEEYNHEDGLARGSEEDEDEEEVEEEPEEEDELGEEAIEPAGEVPSEGLTNGRAPTGSAGGASNP